MRPYSIERRVTRNARNHLPFGSVFSTPRGVARGAIRKACACVLVTLSTGLVMAVPFTPATDAEIVQRLPARLDAAARQQRAALARNPAQLPLALAAAQAAIERSRRLGDPRELGQAQAALAPWWADAAPPAAVRLLRATVRQSQHEFASALSDLEALAADPRTPLPVQAQAGLTQATVLQVTGRLAEAAQVCAGLQAPRFAGLGTALSVPARACTAELRSLQGGARQASQELAALAREAPGDRWLALLRAELAQRMGDQTAAQARFQEAAPPGAEVYALAARADWLLERGRAAEALSLVSSGDLDADALLLRRAIALHLLRSAQAPAAAEALQARFDAARERGETFHAREEARLALEVRGDPAQALDLALRNWSRQKEPADAVLLARAAQAAGKPEAAAPVRVLARSAGWQDSRLAGLLLAGAP